MTFISLADGRKYAVDIKSTYRIDSNTVNGMTLGAFTGYFRKRSSNKNIAFPYQDYSAHLVLGCIYTKTKDYISEKDVYALHDLEKISSVVRDFVFFAQPKYKIASSRPGSGNTKNIGSVTKINQLLNGTGPFAELGEEIYDDYWMFYLTRDMARALEVPRPYADLKTYLAYKRRVPPLDLEGAEKVERLDTGPEEEEMPEEAEE